MNTLARGNRPDDGFYMYYMHNPSSGTRMEQSGAGVERLVGRCRLGLSVRLGLWRAAAALSRLLRRRVALT